MELHRLVCTFRFGHSMGEIATKLIDLVVLDCSWCLSVGILRVNTARARLVDVCRHLCDTCVLRVDRRVLVRSRGTLNIDRFGSSCVAALNAAVFVAIAL